MYDMSSLSLTLLLPVLRIPPVKNLHHIISEKVKSLRYITYGTVRAGQAAMIYTALRAG